MMYEVLCANNSVGSWLLRICMASKWSHAAVWDMHRGIVTHTTLWGGGVKEVESNKFFDHYPHFQITDLALHDEPSAREWLAAQVDKPYDWTALLWFPAQLFLVRDWQEDDKWFCSELVETLRSRFGTPRFRERLSHVSPRHMGMLL